MRKIVALVPARSGSVRVKHKNLRQFEGIPLLGLAVRQALLAECVDEVYVSTDSTLYAEIAENYGAKVPFIRPQEISGSDATDYDVFMHFLKWYLNRFQELPEMIVQVRPTAPVRQSRSIKEAIHFMMSHPDFDSLRSVSTPHQSPYKMWNMDNYYNLSPILFTDEADSYDKPTQSLPRAYSQDGIVDIVRPETLLNYHSMAGKKIAGFIDHPDTWDIDTKEDLKNAEKMFKEKEHFLLMCKSYALGGNLGIIQGRLTESNILQRFPDNNWRKEFEMARKAGYTSIEWIRDKNPNNNNPIWNEAFNSLEINSVSILNGVSIRSICDDYVQECDWEKLSFKQLELLIELIIRASRLGVKTIVYPLFCDAEIMSDSKLLAFKACMSLLANIAATQNINIALEISASVGILCKIFEVIQFSNVGICVDTGNLYAANISPLDIFENTQLMDKVYHIHIKDRDSLDNNVVLGDGDVDFETIISSLLKHNYSGLLITETSRGNNPYDTAIKNKEFLCDIISRLKC